jgi:hypothetical protein
VLIQDQSGKLAIGLAGAGNMLLREMFSPIGAPNEEEADIDWLGDLKFYIDNDDQLLQKYMFPALKKHEHHKGNPNVYKLYLRALQPCLDQYCKKYEVKDKEEKFTEEKLIELAKRIATEQEKHIEDGDYHRDEA